MHDQKVAVEAGGLEMIADLAEIAAHARPDIGVRRRRRGALELAIFLRELVRGGDEKMRMAFLDDLFHALLVRVVAVGMQEQDGDRLYALPHRVGHGGAHLIFIELDQHLAMRIHALADLVAQVALDQWLVAAKEEVVGFRPIDAADLVDVAEALRGEERGRRPRPLQNGVDRNGGAVKEKTRAGELRAGLNNPTLHAGDEPRRRCERLSEAKLPGRLVEGGHVGEGPAHVGRQPNST